MVERLMIECVNAGRCDAPVVNRIRDSRARLITALCAAEHHDGNLLHGHAMIAHGKKEEQRLTLDGKAPERHVNVTYCDHDSILR